MNLKDALSDEDREKMEQAMKDSRRNGTKYGRLIESEQGEDDG